MDVSEDVVYVENGAERYEYVMNERGRLFYGRASKISSRPWYFGQVGNWSTITDGNKFINYY